MRISQDYQDHNPTISLQAMHFWQRHSCLTNQHYTNRWVYAAMMTSIVGNIRGSVHVVIASALSE